MTIEEMFKIGIDLRNSGESEKAISHFHSIINLFPNHRKIAGVYTTLAGLYKDLNDYQQAQLYFNEASKRNPNSELTSLGLYICLAKQGHDEEAILEMKRYLENNPAELYKTTIMELLEGLKDGYMNNFEELIYSFAKKNGL